MRTGNGTARIAYASLVIVTTTFERVLHLFLFLSAAVAFGVLGLAALERVLADGGRRTIQLGHVALAMAVFLALFIAERIYHLVH
jgi:hypothetical protein